MLLFLVEEFPECATVKVKKPDKLQQRAFNFGNYLVGRDIRKSHRKFEEQTFKF